MWESWEYVAGLIGTCATVAALFFAFGQGIGRRVESGRFQQAYDNIHRREATHLKLTNEVEHLRIENEQLKEASDEGTPAVSLRSIEAIFSSDKQIWSTHPAIKSPTHDHYIRAAETKVITVGNLKGGVGKTTLAANLAAYLDRDRGKRVLLIDLDYQGSLSDTLMIQSRTAKPKSRIDDWFETDPNVQLLAASVNPMHSPLERSNFVPAFYEFAALEDRLLIRWLLMNDRDRTEQTDVRFRLARLLQSDYFASRYEVVVIDTAPRLSAGTINALCASTHLIIPTVPDRLSAEAVPNFTALASLVLTDLNPKLRLAGIAPTMTFQEPKLNDAEEGVFISIRENATHFDGVPYVFQRHIPRKQPIANAAGTSIALLSSDNVTRTIFQDWGAEVSERIGL